LEADVKNRASLLRNLTHFDRYSKMCLARIDSESAQTLKSGDLDDLAHTSRQIARVQLNMMKLSRELEAVSNQIRAKVGGRALCVTMSAPAVASERSPNGGKLPGASARERFAFTAVMTENGAVVVRVLEETSGTWPQREYGRFETWTQALEFATILNQSYGIDPMEAQHIVVSANLATRSSKRRL
jgi:hypothetical protein